MAGKLTMHTGKKFHRVDVDDLASIPTPSSTRTWCPIEHNWLVRETLRSIGNNGFLLRDTDIRVSEDGKEMFGIIDIGAVGQPWGLSVGLRNTNNKRASAAILLGQKVWLCDNLAYSADYTLVRKHHPGSYNVLLDNISEIMGHLPMYQRTQAQKVERMQNFFPADEVVSHTIIRAAEMGGILTGDILKVLGEFRNPSGENPESANRNMWGLFNAATFIGRDYFQKNPETAAQRSLALTKLFEEVTP